MYERQKVCNFGAVKVPSISAIEVFVPDYVLTNQELTGSIDTTDEWIVSRTGISERRVLKENGKGASFMGIEAVKKLLSIHLIDPLSIDVLICGTCTPDYKLPPTATIISSACGLQNAWAFDMNATCSGFLYGLEMAKMMVESGRYKKVLLVNTEKMSSIIDYSDRNTCILFGDGASAVLVEKSEDGFALEDILLFADGSEADKIMVKGGGSAFPVDSDSQINEDMYFKQDGKAVFKKAVLGMEESCRMLLNKNHLKTEDIKYFIGHQANKRILDTLAERLEVNEERMLTNILNYGNTSSVSIPLCLFDYQKQFKNGDKIILTAFGSGYTWGATLLTFNC